MPYRIRLSWCAGRSSVERDLHPSADNPNLHPNRHRGRSKPLALPSKKVTCSGRIVNSFAHTILIFAPCDTARRDLSNGQIKQNLRF
eukprot:3622926-Prymnesium_polylepis.1